jgi:type IV pilus assembly protein PilV
MNTGRHRVAGFTLIEVLITVTVVSVGLLAVAGLQAMAKKANYDAVQRSTAASLGQSIIERIRANPTQGAAYAGSDISESAPTSSQICNPAPNAALPATAGAACTAAQTAQADRYAWSQELFGAAEAVPASGSVAADTNLGGLQHATGCITLSSCGALNIYTVAIAWRGLTPVAAAGTDATDPSSNSCGSADTGYQPPANISSALTMRRVLVLQAAIIDPSLGSRPPC